jgi:hypothetical protein
MMDTRNPLQPAHSRISSLAREGPSFVLLLSHKRPCQILVLTASWDFIINNNSRKSPISRRILGITRCTFGLQLDANTRKCTSRPIANRQGTGIGDRTSLGAHSRRRPKSVVTTTCGRARHAPWHVVFRRQKTMTNSGTELSCTALCVVQPPRRGQQIPWRIRYRNT